MLRFNQGLSGPDGSLSRVPAVRVQTKHLPNSWHLRACDHSHTRTEPVSTHRVNCVPCPTQRLLEKGLFWLLPLSKPGWANPEVMR